jgi:hypothetical protein
MFAAIRHSGRDADDQAVKACRLLGKSVLSEQSSARERANDCEITSQTHTANGRKPSSRSIAAT